MASDLVKQRIRWRILAKLAEVGFGGITRSALLQAVAKNDYAAGAEVLDSMGTSVIEHFDKHKKIRLELVAVDAIRCVNPKAVEHWFDLSTPAARAFRQWRLDTYMGLDCTAPIAAGEARTPTVYTNAEPQVEVETSPEPEPGPEPDPEPDPEPETEPQVEVESFPAVSTQGFWEVEDAAREDAALAGFWS